MHTHELRAAAVVFAHIPNMAFDELIATLLYDEGERPKGVEPRPRFLRHSNKQLARELVQLTTQRGKAG